EPVFDDQLLHSLAGVFVWLFATLPVGDPIRGKLPVLLERTRARLSNPNLLIGPTWVQGDLLAAIEALPGQPYRPPGGQPLASSHDAGSVVVVRYSYGTTTYGSVSVRPAYAREPYDRHLLTLIGGLQASFAAARFLFSDGAQAMAERVRGTPVAAG